MSPSGRVKVEISITEPVQDTVLVMVICSDISEPEAGEAHCDMADKAPNESRFPTRSRAILHKNCDRKKPSGIL